VASGGSTVAGNGEREDEMDRRTLLLSMGSSLVVLAVGCGGDADDDDGLHGDPVTRPPGDSSGGDAGLGATEADAALIAAALGRWQAVDLYDSGPDPFTLDVEIRADGTFTLGASGEGQTDGTWQLEDGALTLELAEPDADGEPGAVLRCVLEDASLDTTAMRMVEYTQDGRDQLEPGGLEVAVALEGSEVVLDEAWRCIPVDAAGAAGPELDDDALAQALQGEWDLAQGQSTGCSIGRVEPVELTLASFRTIAVDGDRFEATLWCALTYDDGVSATPATAETATGSIDVADGRVGLVDVELDGEPWSEQAATWAADHPTEVEVDGDVLYARAEPARDAVRFERV
jgi:hypothetical protein